MSEPTSAPAPFHVAQPGGYVDNMLLQTRANHAQLSAMADNKANMLIAASALVIPLTVQHLQSPTLRLPALVLILCCVVTIALATVSVMPRREPRPVVDPRDPAFNLLFFGHFTTLPYAGYLEVMGEALNDPTRTYEIQLREIYLHGRYLAQHKFRLLAYAYLSFITGVLLSLALWGLVQAGGG